MSANPDSVANQGEFHSSRGPARNHPMAPGHDTSQKIGNDAYPTFHAETHPPGAAPREDTFRPKAQAETPEQALNASMESSSLRTGALDFPGATSQDVHNANTLAKPMRGQTSKEMRDNSERSGLEGVGASSKGEGVKGLVRRKGADLPEGVERGVRSRLEKSEGGYEAQEREPASAGEVASERR